MVCFFKSITRILTGAYFSGRHRRAFLRDDQEHLQGPKRDQLDQRDQRQTRAQDNHHQALLDEEVRRDDLKVSLTETRHKPRNERIWSTLYPCTLAARGSPASPVVQADVGRAKGLLLVRPFPFPSSIFCIASEYMWYFCLLKKSPNTSVISSVMDLRLHLKDMYRSAEPFGIVQAEFQL